MPIGFSVRLLNGHDMPVVGLGTWQSKVGEVGDAVKAAIDAGYRHIDTAENYFNEGEIGDAIQDKINEGVVKREELFITTKLSMSAMGPRDVKWAMEESLRLLKTPYVDLFLIHHPVALSNEGLKAGVRFPAADDGSMKTVDLDPIVTWKEMEKLVDDGLARAIGLSNFNKDQIDRIWNNSRVKPSNLQVECHAYFPQDELMEFCRSKGISFAAYGPIGSPGRPAGREGPDSPVLLEDPVVTALAEKHRRTPAQILLRNLLQRGLVVLPKSISTPRIISNFQVWDFELSDEDMASIKQLNKELRLFQFKFYGKNNFNHPYFPWPKEMDD